MLDSMYPMTGMGTTGSGLGMTGSITPQMIQILLARQAMQGGGMGSPMQGGGAMSPMSALAQMPQKQMGMAPMAPQAVNPNMQAQGQQGVGAMLQNPQILAQLMALLKGGQSGLPVGAPGGGFPPGMMTAPNGMMGGGV
jgi:hypothetical protein